MTGTSKIFASTLVLALAACTVPGGGDDATTPLPGGDPATGTRPSGQPHLVTKEGTIEQGVECPILRTTNGEVWSISQSGSDFGPGDHVRITGEIADASFCMQGEGTLIPQRIVAVPPPAG